jgi:hypothetical protein
MVLDPKQLPEQRRRGTRWEAFFCSRGSRVLQAFLYLSFITLWFKGNFHSLRKLHLSPLIFLIPLSILLAPRIFFFLKAVFVGRTSASGKKLCSLILILILASAFRLPFILHPAGQMDSDDAIMGLMGKHISEGKTPPLYLYGQGYIGSLSSHFYALLFRVFGYSLALLRLSAFLCFLGYLIIQYFLLRGVFSAQFALLSTLFLSLPMGSVVKISMDNSAAFPLILLLGSAVIGLTYVVVFKHEDRWRNPLAFLMGASFWTHLMTMPFLLTAGVFLVFRYRLKARKYLGMILSFLVGAFPFILYEVLNGFGGLTQFFSGEKMALRADRFRWFLKQAGMLVTYQSSFRIVLLFLCLLLGIALLAWESFRKRRLLPEHLYTFFLAFFLIIYFSSAYSGAFRPRYLYPLYFALPVLVLVPLGLIKARFPRTLAITLLAFFLLTPDSWSRYLAEVRDAARRSDQLKTLVAFMNQTRQRYWLSDYWDAYLLTAVSGEKIIVCPLSVKRYRPYELEYDNIAHPTNFLFSLDTPAEMFYAGTLRKTLQKLGLTFKGKKLFNYVLTYDIPQWIPPFIFFRPLPVLLPELVPRRIVRMRNHWSLECQVKNPPDRMGFSGQVDIPGSFSVSSLLSLGQETAVIDFPVPPEGKASLLTNFVGIPLRDAGHTLDLEQIPSIQNDQFLDVVPVSGLSSPLNFMGRNGRLCSQEVKIQILVGKDALSGFRIRLFSPFSFQAVSWYGLYQQSVEVFCAGASLGSYRLEDGENDIYIPGKNISSQEEKISLKLVFRYQMAFDIESMGFMRISAFLMEAKAVR